MQEILQILFLCELNQGPQAVNDAVLELDGLETLSECPELGEGKHGIASFSVEIDLLGVQPVDE
jgi:hypothetical protein